MLQTRKKCAGVLSPGKYFLRSMQQNLPKRHVYTLVKTGSKGSDTRVYFVQMHVGHSKACFKLRGVLWLYDKALPAGLRNVMYKEHRWYRNLNRNGKTRIFI